MTLNILFIVKIPSRRKRAIFPSNGITLKVHSLPLFDVHFFLHSWFYVFLCSSFFLLFFKVGWQICWSICCFCLCPFFCTKDLKNRRSKQWRKQRKKQVFWIRLWRVVRPEKQRRSMRKHKWCKFDLQFGGSVLTPEAQLSSLWLVRLIRNSWKSKDYLSPWFKKSFYT
jgi:ABC-type multidrug transport system fused ATPase/permease subunit